MFRVNLRGALMVLPAFAIGYLAAWIMGELNNNIFVALIAGIVMVPIDLYFRSQNIDTSLTTLRRWFDTSSGGWFAFPVWCTGIGFIVIYLLPAGFLDSL